MQNMTANKMGIQLIATDLDGTLLRNDQTISKTDHETLSKQGKNGIIRVAATGRSLHKVKEVIPQDMPFDYIVFSSGAGIFDWKQKKILHSESFEKITIQLLCEHLLYGDFNFFIYKPIPNNNNFFYHKGAGDCNEFENYLKRHEGDYKLLDINNRPEEAGQIMSIIPNDKDLFIKLKTKIYASCNGVKVIRTSSPLGTNYIWLEIFPESVSKGHGLKWLCEKLNIDTQQTIGIGNDYNDIDMFKFVAYPYLLNNGVEELKNTFNAVPESNQQSGVSAVAKLFNL